MGSPCYVFHDKTEVIKITSHLIFLRRKKTVRDLKKQIICISLKYDPFQFYRKVCSALQLPLIILLGNNYLVTLRDVTLRMQVNETNL